MPQRTIADIQKTIARTTQDYDSIGNRAIGYNAYMANYNRSFPNTDANTSVRSEFTRNDYYYYRPSEAIPNDQQEELIFMSMQAYNRVGIVRNVIDLMSDFACQGIKLVHPTKGIEKFYQKWFKKVQGEERSERFLNMLYRTGNVIVRRMDGKLPSVSADEWKKAYGEEVDFDKIDGKRNIIPARYVFYNPLTVEPIGGELSAFLGKPLFGLKLTPTLKTMLDKYDRMSLTGDLGDIVRSIPQELRTAIKQGLRYLPLDQEKLSVYYYKKDDWLIWANPMIASVLDDLVQLDKMKLADSAALDGAISNVRLWNLGVLDTTNLANSIMPSRAGIQKLRAILSRNVGGGVRELVWGPELSFKESNTQVHQFLGPEKYVATLTSIYVGLGIPPVLTGTSSDGGFTNNYLSIKTLVERLQYGRARLIEFWTEQIERVQKAMGFRFPAQISFDQLVLSDEAAEKALLIQLIDRDLISAETLQGKFDLLADIEKIRIKRERKEHGDTMPEKAGQFHNPDKKHEMNKQLLQRGDVTPSEMGVELKPRKDGEQSPNEKMADLQMKIAKEKVAQQKFSPAKPNGRPKNSKDGGKRKKKRVLPKTKGFIDTYMWASKAQAQISDTLTKVMLGVWDKKNLRQLSTAEAEDLEQLKFATLCNIKPFTEINEDMVYNTLHKQFSDITVAQDAYSVLLSRYIKKEDKLPILDESRQLQVYAYAIVNSKDEDNE